MNSPVQAQACFDCQTVMPGNANFCYNCGKPLKKLPLSTSVSKQIVVYLVSFFATPLGLIYAWKYLREPNDKSKTIGIVAVVLTVVSLILALWLMKGMLDSVSSELNTINNLGF